MVGSPLKRERSAAVPAPQRTTMATAVTIGLGRLLTAESAPLSDRKKKAQHY